MDNYKSQKYSSSVNINKLKCINDNININGNNTGDINIGNKGQLVPTEGYLDAYSSNGDGYGGEGYSKKDKGFDCVINNNNNNTNLVAAADGNEIDSCEECFSILTDAQFNVLLTRVNAGSIGEYCDRLAATPNSVAETESVFLALEQAGASS